VRNSVSNNIIQYSSTIRLLSILFITIISISVFALDELEIKIDKIIRDACRGYSVEMIPEALGDVIYKNSRVCKSIIAHNDDVALALKAVDMSSLRDPKYWKQPTDVTEVSTIEDDFDILNSQADVSDKGSGLGFEDLMGGSEVLPTTQQGSTVNDNATRGDDTLYSGIGFGDIEKDDFHQTAETDEIIGFDESNEIKKSSAYSAQTSLDDIFSSRNEIKVDNSIVQLKQKIGSIYDKCNCLRSKKGCFNGPSFNINDLNNSLRKVESKFNRQFDKVCHNWVNVLDNLPREINYINATAENADNSLVYFAKMNKNFNNAVNKHQSEQNRIDKAKRDAENDSGGFQLDKFIALGVGAAIGGIGNLDSATQLDLLSGMFADSIEGVEGTSNFQGNANVALSRLAPPPIPSINISSSSDINDPLNPNNPIMKRMSEQVKRNVSLHEQKQQQKKQEYEAQLQQLTQQRNQQRSGTQQVSGESVRSDFQQASSTPDEKETSKYSGVSFDEKDDETDPKEAEKEKAKTQPVVVSSAQMFGDSEEYYYSKESSMDMAQTHLQNNTAEQCGGSTKSKLIWDDRLTTCKELNEQFRCKVYAKATCFDKPCDTSFCGTKR
jgi:hypothetical protein